MLLVRTRLDDVGALCRSRGVADFCADVERSVHQQSFSMKMFTGKEESRKLDDFVFSEPTDGSHFLRGILAGLDRGLHLAQTRFGRRVRRRRRLLPVVERRGRAVLANVCEVSSVSLSEHEEGEGERCIRTFTGRGDDRVGGASVKPEIVVARVVPPACKDADFSSVYLSVAGHKGERTAFSVVNVVCRKR